MNDNNEQKKSSKGESFLKGTLILTVAGVVVKVIGSLNWIFVSRILGGEGIGLYQMAFPIYFFALSVSTCLLYTSPSPRDSTLSRMPSSA